MLANDTDPDNDPLFIAQLPTLVRPADQSAAALDLSLTPDGELFFNPDAAGTYVFNYSATDGEETDVAQIRIEVGEPVENRPPIAVRDDVVIPAGGSRLVYVLENDGDPDGDVVGLVGHTADDGLTVKEVEGVGYLVTVAADAPARTTFRYQISDGRSDPVSAVVVVAVTDSVVVNQPPVARADVVEVRAGGKVAVPVIANDYDPEGGALKVVVGDAVRGRRHRARAERPDRRRARRRRTSCRASRSATPSPTTPGTSRAPSSRCASCPPTRSTGRRSPAPTWPARAAACRCAIEVVANDTDPDGDIIAAENIRTQPTGGVARVEAGVVVYTPSDTFTGTDRFTYALVDAGGEIAIGEVLVGVMPLRRGEPGAGGVRRHGRGRRRQRPARVRRARQRLRPRRRPHPRHRRSARRRAGRRRSPTAAAPSCSRRRPQIAPTDGTAAEVAFTYSIDDGRGGTASATVTVRVITRHRGDRPDRRRRPDRPADARRDGRGRPARQRPRPRRQPGRARRRRPATRRWPTATAASSRSPPGRRRAATCTRSPTRPGSPTPPSSPCSSCPTGPRSSSRTSARRRPTSRSPSTSPARPPIPTATRCSSPAARASRAARRRPSPTAPASSRVSFDPDDDFAGPATFSYTVDDQQGHTVAGAGDDRRAAAEQPAAGRRPTPRSPSRPASRPTSTWRRSSPIPTPATRSTFTITDPAEGAVQLRLDGATVQASAAIDQADAHRLVPVHRHRRRRGGGDAPRCRCTVTAAVGPAAAGPARRGDDEPGPGRHGRRARQRHRPARPGPHGDVGRRDASRDRRRPTASRSRSRRAPTSSARRRSSTASATAPTSAARESEAQVDRDGHRPAVGARARRVAVAGNAQATVNWAAPPSNGAPIDDYELRIGERRGAVRRQPDRLHVDRADQRRSRCSSACGPTTAPAGGRGAARRPPSRPTSSRAGRPPRPCSSPTAR